VFVICPKCGGAKLNKTGQAGSGRTRWLCRDCLHRTTNPRNPDDIDVPAVKFNTRLPKSLRYVITSAQNATPVFKPFFAALAQYCAYVDAQLIVIPFRYKNPTSRWTADNEHVEWWAPEIVPYLYDGRFNLSRSLTILADIKVQPTAVSPLTGLESITAERTGIVGHPKVELKTIATPHHRLPKIMVTTGALTVENYSDTKTGKKGEFHHSFAAAVVELDGDRFHLRQITATKDGSFIDLDLAVTANGVTEAPPAEALIMGDTHVDFVDPAVVRATFVDKNAIVPRLRPKVLVWHDLLDFYSRNHHHRGDPMIAVAKHKAGVGSVRDEVTRACAFVDRHSPAGVTNIMVPSNHPDALARWIRESDWRSDPENAEFYLETALEMVRNAHMADGGASTIDPFHYWGRRLLDCRARTVFLAKGAGHSIKGIEVGMHGHEGPNGSRGSIKSFARIGTKSVVGHGHSPGISEGCRQTGTSTFLRLGYNAGGPSSWLQTHDLVYGNAKQTLINIIDGRWCLPRGMHAAAAKAHKLKPVIRHRAARRIV
jgi:hypothetical protein